MPITRTQGLLMTLTLEKKSNPLVIALEAMTGKRLEKFDANCRHQRTSAYHEGVAKDAAWVVGVLDAMRRRALMPMRAECGDAAAFRPTPADSAQDYKALGRMDRDGEGYGPGWWWPDPSLDDDCLAGLCRLLHGKGATADGARLLWPVDGDEWGERPLRTAAILADWARAVADYHRAQAEFWLDAKIKEREERDAQKRRGVQIAAPFAEDGAGADDELDAGREWDVELELEADESLTPECEREVMAVGVEMLERAGARVAKGKGASREGAKARKKATEGAA